jgi:hypothetical protein
VEEVAHWWNSDEDESTLFQPKPMPSYVPVIIYLLPTFQIISHSKLESQNISNLTKIIEWITKIYNIK